MVGMVFYVNIKKIMKQEKRRLTHGNCAPASRGNRPVRAARVPRSLSDLKNFAVENRKILRFMGSLLSLQGRKHEKTVFIRVFLYEKGLSPTNS